MNEFIISIDVDWVPDAAIKAVSSILRQYNIKTTWFVTHSSNAIDNLRSEVGLFELGLHPNFLPGSSQGHSIKEVMTNLLQIVPDAISMRSHAVYQSGPLLSDIVRDTPIKVDSTLFLPEMPNIRPVCHLTPHGKLMRIPFFWADDYELMKSKPNWDFSRFVNVPGIKILMFHPIHIVLNSESLASYNYHKRNGASFDGLELNTMLEMIVNSKKGIASFFMQAVKYIHSSCPKNKIIKDFRSQH